MNFKAISKEMLSFVSKNPTAFHTVASIAENLRRSGFEELLESETWSLNKGGKYYVCRNGSSIIAFIIGNDLSKLYFNITASHSDSPSFKVKENSELHTTGKYTKLNVEGYGGMICSTWMDRPLSLAGRVIVKSKDGSINSRLINIDKDLLLIPSVAIHLNRDINDGYSYNKQIDLLPLFSEGEKDNSLNALISKELNISPEDILSCDLFLYSRERACIWGKDEEYISCSRLDDQQCAFASMKAFTEADCQKSINVLCCFDNEEVGSLTKQGADSTFLYDVLKRICFNLRCSEEEYMKALASSFMLSADNAHAVHPNHPELYDETNRVFMNEGVVVKSHANQKYTSDGVSTAIVKELALRAGVPLQFYANRSDKNSGSTLGNIAMAHTSINCADIGLPQLAMHSCYETAGIKDTLYMIMLLKEFYSSTITLNNSVSFNITKN